MGVRIQAAMSLGNIQDKTAVLPLLQSSLNYSSEWSYFFSKLIDKVFKLKDIELIDVRLRKKAIEAISKIGGPAIEPLRKAFKKGGVEVRRAAVKALGGINDSSIIESLAFALEDVDSDVRLNAAFALWVRKQKGNKIIKKLTITAFKQDESDIADKVAWVLGGLADEHYVESWLTLIEDENSTVRLNVIRTLREIKAKSAVKPLLSLLEDDDYLIKIEAATALGEIKDKQAIAPLIGSLEDENYYFQKSVADALWRITEQYFWLDH